MDNIELVTITKEYYDHMEKEIESLRAQISKKNKNNKKTIECRAYDLETKLKSLPSPMYEGEVIRIILHPEFTSPRFMVGSEICRTEEVTIEVHAKQTEYGRLTWIINI